jgi:arabinan endo-1,5-alpha-L-arabinosidase
MNPNRSHTQTRMLLCLASAALIAGTAYAQGGSPSPAPGQTPPGGGRGGGAPGGGGGGRGRGPQGPTTDPQVHDPVMAKEGDTYYAFGTGLTVQSSKDLKTWNPEPNPFSAAPEWYSKAFGASRFGPWAPDILFRNGSWYLYYAVSTFGRNFSAIGVATNTTLDAKNPNYRWVDRGMIVKSVPGRDMWNAIDPNVFIDQQGKAWMDFGSFWGGIKLLRLKDNLIETADPPEREWHTIAARERYWKLDEREAGDAANPDLKYDVIYPKEVLALDQKTENGAIEAPFVFQKNGWYYLFVSWDRCCRGVDSTYQIVVGRSKTPAGPYLDRKGHRMDWGGGEMVVRGMPASKYAAGGHNGAYTFDGVDYLVLHAYDRTDNGRSKLVIRKIDWEEEWPVVTLEPQK